jgi:hypothetical protein
MITESTRISVFNKCFGKCAYCGIELKKGWHVDHIKPVCEFFPQELGDLEWQAKDLAAQLKESVQNVDKASKAFSFCIAMEKDLITSKSVAYSQPMLIDQISYLREMLNTADQLPGKDAYDRFKSLKMDVEDLLRKWQDKSNIPGFTH